MTAVGQVKRAVMAAIAAAGGAAVESYSVEQLKCYQTAVTAVGAKETVIDESGAIEYLGEKTDEKTQQPVSVYGRRMRLTLLLEVYAPRELGAAGCETAAETVQTRMAVHQTEAARTASQMETMTETAAITSTATMLHRIMASYLQEATT